MSSEYLRGLSSGPSLPSSPFYTVASKVTPKKVGSRLTHLGQSLAQLLPFLLLSVLLMSCFEMCPQGRKPSRLAEWGFLPDPPQRGLTTLEKTLKLTTIIIIIVTIIIVSMPGTVIE